MPPSTTVNRHPLQIGFTMAWLPLGAELLHVGELWGQPYLWVRGDPLARQSGRKIMTSCDGEPVPDGVVHVASLIQSSGVVLHVWDGGEH